MEGRTFECVDMEMPGTLGERSFLSLRWPGCPFTLLPFRDEWSWNQFSNLRPVVSEHIVLSPTHCSNTLNLLRSSDPAPDCLEQS